MDLGYNSFLVKNKLRLFVTSLFFVLVLGLINNARATHLRAGEITVERLDCSSLTFRIKITVYTDTGTEVRFGQGVLTFGDGSDPDDDGEPGIITPTIENTGTDLGDQVAVVVYDTVYTYGSPGTYTIGYVEPNRNEGILNIDNSVNTTFYIETEINISSFIGCNNSPQLLIPPIDRACPGVAFYHNPGAFDPDGDSLSFEIVVPKMNRASNVNGYEPLNDASLYENHSQGNEEQNGPPTFNIDPITGELEWNAPSIIGEYNVAFIVQEWRKIGDNYYPIGYVTRDMQIIVEDCDNERPELQIPEDICVEAGTLIEEEIYGTDPDYDDVMIEAFSQVIENFGATFEPEAFQSSVPQAVGTFTWQTNCGHIREQPYQVVFKITDNPPEGPKLVSFETWHITVVGPAPEWEETEPIVQDAQALSLTWEDYTCQNAQRIEIYRRVESNPYVPDECETGIRENSGYELISTLDSDATNFRDTGLAAAAKYCYRILAVFPEPTGGESIVSEERCFEFVPAEEPIITHVSVLSTNENNGEIEIRWREPFELGTLTPPYTFRIYRGVGFTGNLSSAPVGEVVASDTSAMRFTDTGLNTLDQPYNYTVTIVDASASDGSDEISSAPASSVRMEPTPGFEEIRLDWSARVPWSNNIVYPEVLRHKLYRGLEGTDQEDFELLGSVNVSEAGFSYTDVGLDDSQVYCYRVETAGSYGNPEINGIYPDGFRPQYNFSQIVCAQPSDSIPPCAPIITLDGNTCEELVANGACSFNDFQNELTWSTNFIGECQDDIRVYQLFYAPTTNAEFQLLTETRDTTFIHEGLTSFKGCYKVKAIDRSGNESEFSETFCVDNCPNYMLPNVFTPNGDECNEVFSAYGVNRNIDEQGSGPCGPVDRTQCARFVRSVNFSVFNRWGGKVYEYQSGGENTIYINWDGRSSEGVDLPAGVYYYLAEVTFDVVDPSAAKQDFKGWVHLLR